MKELDVERVLMRKSHRNDIILRIRAKIHDELVVAAELDQLRGVRLDGRTKGLAEGSAMIRISSVEWLIRW